MGQNIFSVSRFQATLICYGEYDLAYAWCRKCDVQCITVKETNEGQPALFIFLPSAASAEHVAKILKLIYEPLQGNS